MLLQRLIPALGYALASVAVAALALTLGLHADQQKSRPDASVNRVNNQSRPPAKAPGRAIMQAQLPCPRAEALFSPLYSTAPQ